MAAWLAANDPSASASARTDAYSRFTASVVPAGAARAALAHVAPSAAYVEHVTSSAEHQAYTDYATASRRQDRQEGGHA